VCGSDCWKSGCRYATASRVDRYPSSTDNHPSASREKTTEDLFGWKKTSRVLNGDNCPSAQLAGFTVTSYSRALMTTSLLVPNESSQLINLPSDLESWKERGAGLMRSLQEVKNSFEMNRWDLGDWLVDGEDQFGEMAYSEAEQLTGWERGSLYNIVWVVRRFPISLRSETGLKWSHFKELARIEDAQVREQLLSRLNDGFSHSVVKVRERVGEALRKLSEKKPSVDLKDGDTKDEVYVYLQVSLKPATRDLVKGYARAERMNPDVLLRTMVEYYIKHHRKKMVAAINRKKPTRFKKAVNKP
jgi:hypothetical protein